jgi:hypothetical protein
MLGKSLGSAKRNKKRKLCKQTSGTKLYQDDHKEVVKICDRNQQTEGEVIRKIVSDWLRGKRVEALGRNQVEDPVRRIYERVIDERINPLTNSINELKAAIKNLPKSGSSPGSIPSTEQPATQSSELQPLLAELRELLEKTSHDVSESSETQISMLDDLLRGYKALHGIGCETFASAWSAVDFLIRYLVEPALKSQVTSLSEAEEISTDERRNLRQDSLRKIADMEAFLRLPENYEFIRSLAQNFSPFEAVAPAS